MIPKPAQYLLRIDDLCPTVYRQRWAQFVQLIEEFAIQPILAVVPDNQDKDLFRADPDPEFWAQMRAMEAAGATIALHGYRHLCRSKCKSLVPLHRHSEFAGVAIDTQRQWLLAGLAILRGHGLNPRIWVAPRHGFDKATLAALRGEGIELLSDGLARVPFTRGGLTWIPQQLWAPVVKSKGVWTICFHPNATKDAEVAQVRAFLEKHASHFTSVDAVISDLKPGRLNTFEWAYEVLFEWRLRASRARKRRRLKTAT